MRERGLMAGFFGYLAAVIVLVGFGLPGGGAGAFAQNSAGQDAVSLNNRGMELYKSGKVDEAIAAFKQAIAMNPNYPEALANLGLALDARGKDDEAVTDLNKAMFIPAEVNAAGFRSI